MITADLIRRGANLSSNHLQELIQERERLVLNAEFVGITNGNEFCYRYQYPDGDSKTGLANGKMFIRVNHNDQLEVV